MGGRMAMSVIAVMLATLPVTVLAADPELTSDFMPPPGVNASDLDGSYFTFTGPRNMTPNSDKFATLTPATLDKGLEALTGLGLDNAMPVFEFPPGTVNRPEYIIEVSETLFVVEGSMFVGLLDSTNKLYTQTLYKGDIFVFPRGLVHFQINLTKETAIAYASPSSSSPGILVVPDNLFGSTPLINTGILSESIATSCDATKALQAAQVR